MDNSFIDTHVHILPGLDDGADTLETACRMAEIAVGDGIGTVAATPHCLDGSHNHEQEQILAAVDALQQELDQRGIALTIYPGAELHSHVHLRELLDQNQVLTLGVGRYVLLEWPAHTIPSYMDQLLFDLMMGGYTPVIAHPERHPWVQDDPNVLYRYLERGALSQVTAGSVTGLFGAHVQATTRVILSHGMAQLIATDAHSASGRKPILSEAYHVASTWLGQEQAAKLVIANPHAVLHGDPISADAVPWERPRWTRWFGLGRWYSSRKGRDKFQIWRIL